MYCGPEAVLYSQKLLQNTHCTGVHVIDLVNERREKTYVPSIT